MSARGAAWRRGAVQAVVLLLAYFLLWQPVRRWLIRAVAYPTLAAVSTERARQFTLALGDDPYLVRVEPVGAYKAPADGFFLVPALLLIGLYPRRRWWIGLWGLHLGLGALYLGMLVVGIGWAGWGFAVGGLIHRYLIPALTLSVMAFVLVKPRGLSRGTASIKTPK